MTIAPIASVLGALPCSLTISQLPARRELVVQQLRRAVEIVDHEVEAAVVVEVADGEAAADALLHQRRAVARRHLVERAVAAVVVEQLALAVAG